MHCGTREAEAVKKKLEDIGIPVKKCPVCGRQFVPAPQHSYHMPYEKYRLVCSYGCHRKAERDHYNKTMGITEVEE